MSCKSIKLGDIPIIANSLKCSTTRAVQTLNSILGFTEFDRSSRNKIRNFSTFPKEFRVEVHKEKILTEFSLPDFISVANLLHLDVETNEQNLCNSIFKALTNLDEFQLTFNNSETSFSESENVVSKTNHVRQEFFIGMDRPALLFSTSGHLSKSCPNHSRGPRCLSCNLYGHKSFECRRANLNNTSTPPSGVNAVHKLLSPINMCKDVTIFGRKLNGLVDTGSNLTLLRNSTYKNIDAPLLKQTNTLLTGVKFAQILRPSDNANENFIMTISDGSPTFDIGPNASQHNRAEVEQRLSTYTPKKTKTVNIELDIALTDDESIFHKPRRLPFAERNIVDAQVDEWVKNAIVKPCSSPYASQVVVVKKKDRKSRFCIDDRRLNRKLIKENYHLPLIDDILDCLQNANESPALEYLKIVLDVASDYGLEINFKKCQFLHNTIEFLGHIIKNGRLFPSTSKTKAVIN
ncbi:uncharacterized protein K02A2.6-like [Trichonephila clavipes]|nr:uncharacterized protein K02A2.6-like [Trichonephila clavipes]